MEEKKNDENRLQESLKQIAFLEKGKQLKGPLLRKVKRALRGKPEGLEAYLQAHPEIIVQAKTQQFIDQQCMQENPFYPLPCEREDIECLTGPLRFGTYNYMGNIFGIDPRRLNLNAIVVGRAGSGKSNLNLISLDQLLEIPGDYNVLIFDIKKEYRTLLPKHKNLKVMPFRRLRFNALHVPQWQDPKEHINSFVEVFCRENLILDRGRNLLLQILEELYSVRGVFDGGRNYPTMRDLYNYTRKWNTQRGETDSKLSILNRLKPYVDYPDVFCCRGGQPDIWLENNIVIELENVTESMYATLTNLIVALIYKYYQRKNIRSNRLSTLCVVDEAGILFSAKKDRDFHFGESYINTLVRRSREYGVSFWVISQEPTTLSQAIHANTILKFMFPLVEAGQIRTMGSSMALNEDQLAYTFKLPPYGTCVVRYGFYKQPFLLDVPLYTGEKAVGDDYIEKMMQGFYQGITQDRMQDQEITERETTQESSIPEDALTLLKHIAQNPFKNTKYHRRWCSLGEYGVDKTAKWLEENGYIRKERIKTKRGRGGVDVYLVLQESAFGTLQIRNNYGKGGFRHQRYCQLIKEKLTKQGWSVSIESAVNLSSKLIDVVAVKDAETVGYEITLHFENLLENIVKDMKILNRLVIVVEKTGTSRAEKIISKYRLPSPDKYIEIKAINEFYL